MQSVYDAPGYDHANPPIENQLVATASHFARVVNRVAKIPMSPVSMRVLARIDHYGPQRISHMAFHESISQPAMTTAVNRLQNDGLVTREPDPTDARAQRVTMTDRGLQTLHDFRSQVRTVIQPKLEALNPEDYAALLRSTEILQTLTEDLTGNA